MFLPKLIAVYELISIFTHSLKLAEGTRQRLNPEKSASHQRRGRIHTREVGLTQSTNNSSIGKGQSQVKDISGARRQFQLLPPHIGAYPQQPLPFLGPIHHVHIQPRPFPVVSVRYVPKPLPIPYPVPSQVHVSHLHLRPKCKFELRHASYVMQSITVVGSPCR